MKIAAILVLITALVVPTQTRARAIGTPSPAPTASPLKNIAHVRTSILCSTLSHNVFQAVRGLRVNDGLVGQGRVMMAKIAYDAVTSPKSMAPGGGAGSASQMDDVQMGILVNAMAQNIGRIETLLTDAQRFPSVPTNDDQRALGLAKTRLEAVLTQQRVSLNILSRTVETNELLDLQSRCNPIDPSCNSPTGPGPNRVAMPKALAIGQMLTQQTENNVTPAILPIAAACR